MLNALFSALISAFTLLLMYKVGVIEIMQIRGSNLISKMANCQFCLSFWVNVIVSFICYLVTRDCNFIYAPFLATPITRYLL